MVPDPDHNKKRLLPRPYVGAHIGVYDPAPNESLGKGDVAETWQKERDLKLYPRLYDEIRFDAVDVLHIGHFIVTLDGNFQVGTKDFDQGKVKVDLAHRFEHIVRIARRKNPKIIIIAEQMYSPKEGFDNLLRGNPLALDPKLLDRHTDSITDLLKTWRLDGYDVDLEDGSTNYPCLKDVLSSLSEKLKKLTAANPRYPPFIIGISSDRPTYGVEDRFDGTSLGKVVEYCDFINMQRYSGGIGILPTAYLQEKVGEDQLTYGFETERPKRNATEVEKEDSTITGESVLARVMQDCKVMDKTPLYNGYWTWRLGSDNWIWQNLFQIWLHNTLHPNETQLTYSENGKEVVPTFDTIKDRWIVEYKKGI